MDKIFVFQMMAAPDSDTGIQDMHLQGGALTVPFDLVMVLTFLAIYHPIPFF